MSRNENIGTIRRTLHFYWCITKKRPLPFIVGMLSTIGFVALLTYANTYVMGLIIDRVQQGMVAPNQVFEVFGGYIIALVLVNLFGQICSKLQDYSSYKLQINGNYDLARLCFDTLSNQSMTFHANRFGGSLVSQTTKFMSAYGLLMDTLLFSLLPLIISVVCTVGLLVAVVPSYVVILCVILVIYVIVVVLLFKRIMPLSAAAASAQNKLSGVLSDAVTNILAVKTYGREDYERDLFAAADVESMRAESVSMRASLKRGFTTSAILVIIMSVVSVFTAGGNAWFGISAGTLVMMFTYTYNLTMRFNMLNAILMRMNRVFGDSAEMTRILDEPTLVADVPDAPPLVVEHGRIDFEHIGFAYDDDFTPEVDELREEQKKLDKGNPEKDGSCEVFITEVFRDLNLHIPAGQRVGLVGHSGSGKTTLTKLLLRLSDVQQGHILVDGQDISKCTQQSLRRQVAYVPQEALLFHRSIRENIAYGKPTASEEEIREAARLANALDFIEEMPAGFDTLIGERGIKLSGGQRQRIAIARAILADAPILVLDEATSALDSESEAAVQEALQNLMAGRTSIVVAHRLSTVASLDRIVVLDNGKIVEDGTHADLIGQDGEYAQLWHRQTGAFLE